MDDAALLALAEEVEHQVGVFLVCCSVVVFGFRVVGGFPSGSVGSDCPRTFLRTQRGVAHYEPPPPPPPPPQDDEGLGALMSSWHGSGSAYGGAADEEDGMDDAFYHSGEQQGGEGKGDEESAMPGWEACEE